MGDLIQRPHILLFGLSTYLIACFGSMAMMSIGMLFALIGVFSVGTGGVTHLRGVFRSPSIRFYAYWTILWLIICIASLVSADLSPLVFNEKSAEINYLKDLNKVFYLIIPFVLMFGISALDESRKIRLMRFWVLGFGVLSLVGCIQFFTGWPRPQGIPGYEGFFHTNLLFGHHLSFANIWIFPFFAVLDLAFKKDLLKKMNIQPVWVWTFVFLGGIALFLSFSRMTWIALPIGVVIFFLWKFIQMAQKKRAVIFLLLIGLTGFGVLQTSFVQKRIQQSMGIETRLTLWEGNWDLFKMKPILGIGWRKTESTFPLYHQAMSGREVFFSGHAHNIFIEILTGTGVVGAFVWAVWIFLLFRMLFLRMKNGEGEPHLAMGLICGLIVFLLSGLTQVNFYDAKVQHQLNWVVGWALAWMVPLKKGELK